MSETEQIRLNRLPAITWYWLNMNETAVPYSGTDGEAAAEVKIPSGVSESREKIEAKEEYRDFAEQPTGAGKHFSQLFEENGIRTRIFTTAAGAKPGAALKIRIPFESGHKTLNSFAFDLGRDSELTVIMDFTSDPEASGEAGVRTLFRLGENAVLKLVQITRTGSGFTLVNDIGGHESDSARTEVVQLNLDGGKVCQGYQIDLAGYKSSLKTDIAYRLKDSEHLDMNYFANHTGKKSECEISVTGVLRDTSSKILRATIDLKKGAKGAVGNEKEDVLLMDEGVRNQTIPLILCTEEDVEGNHGATIGRLDESLMFYLESRGLDREEIYEMMAAARIAAAAALIPDEETRSEVEQYIGAGSEE